MNEEIKLPSGAVLKISTVPFAEALALNEVLIEELKGIDLHSSAELVGIYKDLFCIGFSSKKIKEALWKCFQRCTYNSGKGDLKIDQDTFEPMEARQDYPIVCMEVAKYVVLPFVKSHSAKFFQILESLQSSPGSRSSTTPT